MRAFVGGTIQATALASPRRLASAALLLLAIATPAAAQPATLTGFLNLIWADPDDGSEPELLLYISADGSTLTRLRPAAGVDFGYDDLHRMNGQVVVASGRPSAADLPNGQRSPDFDVESLQFERPPLPPAPRDSGPLLAGPQPWVSILCRFGDATGLTPQPASLYQTILTGPGPNQDAYWREASYDNIHLAGSGVAGWFNLPQPRSYYVYDQDGNGTLDFDFQRTSADCAAAADAQVDFTAFAGINFVLNQNFNGYAYGGGITLTIDGVTRSWRATWMPSGSTSAGLSHTRWATASGSRTPRVPTGRSTTRGGT